MSRYIIKDSERGHRSPLSKTEKTVKYTLSLTESQKARAIKLGQSFFRDLLDTTISSTSSKWYAVNSEEKGKAAR